MGQVIAEKQSNSKKLTNFLHDVMSGNHLVHPVLRVTLRILSVLLAVTLIPLVIVTAFLPLLAIRQIGILTRIFKKELRFGRGTPFSLMSGFLCVDNFYTKPKNNEAAMLYMDSSIDITTVKKRMDALIKSNKFPELTMYLTRHLGFYFWGKCFTFDLSEHIYECPLEEELDDAGLHKYHDFFTKKPWREGKPLWEIVVFPQYKNGSAFALRVHHSLADGFGLYNLFNAMSDNMQDLKLSLPKTPKLSKRFISETLGVAKDFLRYTSSVVYNTLTNVEFNAWMKQEEHRVEDNYNYAAPIDLNYLKTVSKKLGISLSELVVAGMTGAVREAFMRYGDPLPRKVSSLYPLPVPTHSGGMTNDFIPSTMHLPIGMSDRKQRLKIISADFQEKRASRWVQYYLCVGFALLQQWTKKSAVGVPACTLALSNLSFPSTQWEMFGAKVTHLIIHNEISFHLPMSVVTMGYNGKMWVWLKVRADICKYEEQELKVIFEDFKKEIDIMYKEEHGMDNQDNLVILPAGQLTSILTSCRNSLVSTCHADEQTTTITAY